MRSGVIFSPAVATFSTGQRRATGATPLECAVALPWHFMKVCFKERAAADLTPTGWGENIGFTSHVGHPDLLKSDSGGIRGELSDKMVAISVRNSNRVHYVHIFIKRSVQSLLRCIRKTLSPFLPLQKILNRGR